MPWFTIARKKLCLSREPPGLVNASSCSKVREKVLLRPRSPKERTRVEHLPHLRRRRNKGSSGRRPKLLDRLAAVKNGMHEISDKAMNDVIHSSWEL